MAALREMVSDVHPRIKIALTSREALRPAPTAVDPRPRPHHNGPMNVDAVHGFESTVATVAFVDLAGFSAITDVYGDASAISVLRCFEDLVSQALEGLGPPIKWIGDEAMFGFPDPATALKVLGRLIPACRSESRIPLTRTGLNHGPVLRRGNDLFGSTVNIAARIAAFASPGQLLATQPVANIAAASGIVARDMGTVALRSIADGVSLHSIEFAPAFDPAWIDPVCKMLAPYAAYHRTSPTEPWFCSERCAEAYLRSPQIYPSAPKVSSPA
jgi:adenylate cyclase